MNAFEEEEHVVVFFLNDGHFVGGLPLNNSCRCVVSKKTSSSRNDYLPWVTRKKHKGLKPLALFIEALTYGIPTSNSV